MLIIFYIHLTISHISSSHTFSNLIRFKNGIMLKTM